MKIRSNTRKVFKTTPEAERTNCLFEILTHKNSARNWCEKTFVKILGRLEDGEYHNSRSMKELKRNLERWIESYSNHSMLFAEWGELMEKSDLKCEKKRKS